MKLFFLTIFSLFIINNISFAQNKFLPGYFISNEGDKISCEILNADWKYYPKEISYRLLGTSAELKINTDEIQGFFIEQGPYYKRFIVKIDRSSDDVNVMSNNAEPEFKEEKLMLKVLLEGKANLYQYEDRNLVRYFIKKDSLPIEQLIFKKYLKLSNVVLENTAFRQQLAIYLDCEGMKKTVFEFINYYEYELTKVVANYNMCVNPVLKIKVPKKIKLSVNARLGINNQSFKLASSNINYKNINVDFGSSTNGRIGAEAEIFLPFNNKHWSVIFEPTYRYFKGTGTAIKFNTTGPSQTQNVICNYASIEFPIGLRYNAYINNKVYLFANVVYHFEKTLQSKIVYDDGSIVNVKFRSRPMFGIGISVLKKWSAELRLRSNTKIGDYQFIAADYKSLAFILGYRLF